MNKLIVGLTVDSLKEIIALPEENIKPTPKLAAMQTEADVTSGLARIGKRIIPILDLAHIVTKKEATELSGRERLKISYPSPPTISLFFRSCSSTHAASVLKKRGTSPCISLSGSVYKKEVTTLTENITTF